jgi:hypothetical protein
MFDHELADVVPAHIRHVAKRERRGGVRRVDYDRTRLDFCFLTYQHRWDQQGKAGACR